MTPISKVATLMICDSEKHTMDHFIKNTFTFNRQFDRKLYRLLEINPKRYRKSWDL